MMDRFIDFLLWLTVGTLVVFYGCGKSAELIQGPTGPSGKNGYSIVVAPGAQANGLCASGSGSVVTFAEDNAEKGVYVPGDTILNSVLICNGVAGPSGTPGAVGPQGPTGPQATPVYMVQFCPNQGAPIYYSNIPEFGFCVEGALYGLTIDSSGNYEIGQIMNGSFTDKANNTSCNFTVSGCTVTQN